MKKNLSRHAWWLIHKRIGLIHTHILIFQLTASTMFSLASFPLLPVSLFNSSVSNMRNWTMPAEWEVGVGVRRLATTVCTFLKCCKFHQVNFSPSTVSSSTCPLNLHMSLCISCLKFTFVSFEYSAPYINLRVVAIAYLLVSIKVVQPPFGVARLFPASSLPWRGH